MPIEKNLNQDTAQSKAEKILEENLELTKEIHKMVKSVKSFVLLQRIWFFIKILLIVVPLIFGIIYLPPLMEQLLQEYNRIMGLTDQVENISEKTNQINLDAIPDDIKNLLK